LSTADVFAILFQKSIREKVFIYLLFSWQKSNKKPRKINAINPQKAWHAR